MPYSSKVTMRDLLSEGLYELMKDKPFEKITIKQICDKTGVIRGTFYNHFMDKYEALEYLTEKLLVDKSISNDMERIAHVFHVIEENRAFFHKAYQIQGQNSFHSMLLNIFKHRLLEIYNEKNIVYENHLFSSEYMARYHATTLLFVIDDWLQHGCKESCELLIQRCQYLVTHSIQQIVNK